MSQKRRAQEPEVLTRAAGITTDVVLKLSLYRTAKEMRSVQTGLTTAARELRSLTQSGSLLGSLGERLSPEQRELLTNAARLLDSIKYNVEHAKETKVRTEKALAKKRDQWTREAEKLVNANFVMPMESLADHLRILELYLVARVVLGPAIYMLDHPQLRQVVKEQPPLWSKVTMAQWLQGRAGTLLVDIRTAFCDYLKSDLNLTPAKRLEDLQVSLAERRQQILAQPQAVETVQVWSDSLKGLTLLPP
ncbi:TPA: hypothetical protein ACG5DM_004193 [Pseudomonas putida]|uniref:Uncharacterized protein n=2 Tax=Pseudomonas TaxID=286 RepID=A0AAJ5S5K0_9PSED|nr:MULTISPECIES: hypothetical protein [Pseudomonas]MCT8166667.1 hypothetical protein [Pseudomonas sp. HD6422]MCT8185563.1 hypothetical protein [Pseudomonas sp. HD6421]MDM1714467.1 hypothetical protein [Pseudomonas sp. 165]ORL48033.1 hypothetical protein B7H18_29170 [Pseudomonas putida]ORL62886.1 hypothetical protein B7H19_27295 [Pseudomonas putida]